MMENLGGPYDRFLFKNQPIGEIRHTRKTHHLLTTSQATTTLHRTHTCLKRLHRTYLPSFPQTKRDAPPHKHHPNRQLPLHRRSPLNARSTATPLDDPHQPPTKFTHSKYVANHRAWLSTTGPTNPTHTDDLKMAQWRKSSATPVRKHT